MNDTKPPGDTDAPEPPAETLPELPAAASSELPAATPPELPATPPPAAAEPGQPRRRITPKSPRQALQPEAAPPPPARSQKARHPLVVVLNFFLMIVVLVVLGSGAAFYFGRQHFARPGPLTEPASVVVARGADVQGIAEQLKRQNVIDNELVFTSAVRFYKAADQLKAGEYLFQPGVSMEQVLDDLISGRSVLHAITFPEGLTSQQIVDRLKADTVLTGDVTAVPSEGALMPDTYKFTRGATRQQIIDQMERAKDKTVSEIWARRSADLPIATPEEFVTLASIVEKETGKADERPRVAAVFINRLKQGMRLQSDPTIIYGLFGGAGKPSDRAILQSDLDKPTAYNTYQVSGLPPTPIANPGKAALEAVANPSRTNEIYFVADGSGGHAFAATIEEHNRNVARWRRIEAARLEAQKAAEAAAGSGAAPPAPAAAPVPTAPTAPAAPNPGVTQPAN
jgi:UPF0755 protein